jgi:hypothetical protein
MRTFRTNSFSAAALAVISLPLSAFLKVSVPEPHEEEKPAIRYKVRKKAKSPEFFNLLLLPSGRLRIFLPFRKDLTKNV